MYADTFIHDSDLHLTGPQYNFLPGTYRPEERPATVHDSHFRYGSEELPLYAPIPVASHHSVLAFSDSPFSASFPPAPPHASPHTELISMTGQIEDSLSPYDLIEHNIPWDTFVDIPQQTFPTPSELLTELLAQDSTVVARTEPVPERRLETQRKARQRAVAESIGFEPTDPDTISSHDKKRHYLSCLESYVQFLHEQLILIGAQPLRFERVLSNPRGLTSRSIRTLLVHMEENLKKLHQETLSEERVFMDLRRQVEQGDQNRFSLSSCH